MARKSGGTHLKTRGANADPYLTGKGPYRMTQRHGKQEEAEVRGRVHLVLWPDSESYPDLPFNLSILIAKLSAFWVSLWVQFYEEGANA